MENADTARYAVYFTTSGKIDRVVTCSPAQAQFQAQEGEALVVVGAAVADATHYIRDGVAVEKGALSPVATTDGMDATITGLPAGLRIEWDGMEGVTDDEPLELDHDEPGIYTLRIYGGAPYLDTELEVALG